MRKVLDILLLPFVFLVVEDEGESKFLKGLRWVLRILFFPILLVMGLIMLLEHETPE